MIMLQPLTVSQDRALIRSRWHSQRFIVARVRAPQQASRAERAPVNLAFVLDRSGSMGGRKIALAKQAVVEAIARLQPADRFSVIAFDNVVEVVVPGAMATPAHRRAAVERLGTIGARGSTHLSGGWLAGCEQVASALAEDGVNRCLVLTDGLANHGITDGHELARHAGELRARGVSTTTFGVGNDFDEVLLQAMAQAGGGHFYDIAGAEQIRDHIESEVGETLEVVARDVRLEIDTPTGVRIESLGAFGAHDHSGRVAIDLGDLVSGQEVDVPLRLAFGLGGVGETVPAVLTLTDRDGVLDGAAGRAAWTYADDPANDAQPRERSVDRIVARIFAARARQAAVGLNRRGEFDAAAEGMRATARRIRSYAGRDRELRAIADELERDAERFAHHLAERSRKEAYGMSANMLSSRDMQGKARRA